jgi:hypothetical protein
MNWSEKSIAAALSRQIFNHKYLVVVPNTSWTGNECDLLVVTENLRVIDVEIKISRSDLKADAKKDKWFQNWDYRIDGPQAFGDQSARRAREWPQKVWKHYYALPAEIWNDSLLETLGSPKSGVLLLQRDEKGAIKVQVKRIAAPCREAERLSATQAVDIARLASLRMWDAYEKAEKALAKQSMEVAA